MQMPLKVVFITSSYSKGGVFWCLKKGGDSNKVWIIPFCKKQRVVRSVNFTFDSNGVNNRGSQN